jgi:hypothetical protein
VPPPFSALTAAGTQVRRARVTPRSHVIGRQFGCLMIGTRLSDAARAACVRLRRCRSRRVTSLTLSGSVDSRKKITLAFHQLIRRRHANRWMACRSRERVQRVTVARCRLADEILSCANSPHTLQSHNIGGRPHTMSVKCISIKNSLPLSCVAEEHL